MQWEKRNISRLVGIATVVAVIAGCTGGFKPFKRQDHFPKQEELQKIDERPAPARVFEQMDQVRLAQWQLTGPFPDMIGAVPRQPVDDLDQLAAREAAAIGGVATEAMRCVARETGKIYLAYGKRPELALRRFIQHRCGSTSGTISTAWVSWEEGDLDWAEADKDDAASGSLREEIAAAGTSFENAEVGAWYGASGGRAVAMIAVGRRLIELEPTATTGLKNGTFDLRGSVLDPAAEVVSGVVNHGLYEWERCHALPAKLPRFHLRCHAEPNDVEAGFEIYIRRRGDLLASAVLWQRVWPAGAAPDRYVLHEAPEVTANDAVVEPAPDSAMVSGDAATATPGVADAQAVEGTEVPMQPGETEGATEHDVAEALPEPLKPEPFETSATVLRATLLNLINEARVRGNLAPVALAQKQSTAADSLSPHFWEAAGKSDRDTTNQIMYGLLAGWEVAGPIVNGTFFTSNVHGGPRDLVSEFVARPGARSVVFGPEIEKLSIGVHYEPDSQNLGGIVHGWEFVPDETHTKRVNRFLEFVTDARKARGNAKPKVSTLNGYTFELSKKLSSRELELHQAAKKLVERFAEANRGERVMVYYFEAHDPTSVEIPQEILNVTPLHVAMVVAPYKPSKSPWNVYGVIVAYIAYDSPTKIAALDVPHRPADRGVNAP